MAILSFCKIGILAFYICTFTDFCLSMAECHQKSLDQEKVQKMFTNKIMYISLDPAVMHHGQALQIGGMHLVRFICTAHSLLFHFLVVSHLFVAQKIYLSINRKNLYWPFLFNSSC